MTAEELERIRDQLGLTQEGMADLLQVDYIGYKRYATGARPVPRYVARSAKVLQFVHESGLLPRLQKRLT
ncbi:helix-turn-helix domain-containing protein [Paraburkholderia sp. A3RO-2L]|uniref:helix-turn-helix domain-containing protein n=1 Tax=Paraburkholderia sp. A3RO-2L TaxID=3028376 RepID=UPI003DA952D0